MSVGTVFPELTIGFAETVEDTVEGVKKKAWSLDDIKEVIAASRKVRDSFESLERTLRHQLGQGVDIDSFVTREESHLPRVEVLVRRHYALLGAWDRLQTDLSTTEYASEAKKLTVEWEAAGQAMTQVRNLVRKTLATMKTPRRPVDMKRVQAAQAAFQKGETILLEGTPKSSDD